MMTVHSSGEKLALFGSATTCARRGGENPQAQGLGLGRLMTATGLRHLSEKGVAEISLYVDGDNTAALALYRSLGFVDHHVDSQWRTA